MTPVENWFIQNWGIIPQNPRQEIDAALEEYFDVLDAQMDKATEDRNDEFAMELWSIFERELRAAVKMINQERKWGQVKTPLLKRRTKAFTKYFMQ
jgi:hypothetical protein